MNKRLVLLAVVMASLFFALVLAWVPQRTFDGLDRKASDLAWRLGAQREPERRIIVVDIDENSIATLGAWPWPRERVAELSKRLAELGASQQIFDMLLVDRRSGDDGLGAALAAAGVVTANVFALDQGEPVQQGQLAGSVDGLPCQQPIPQARGYIGLSPGLLEHQALPAGHITPRIDADGAVRRVPALLCLADKVYPALALAAYWQGAVGHLEPGSIRLRPGQGWLEPAWWLEHARLPAAIPLTAEADLIVPYALAPEALISISAADILAGKAPKSLFAGAWVLVGSTALGLGDAVPTPHGGAVGGVGVHAQLISGLLDGTLPLAPVGRYWLWLANAILLCGLLTLVATRFGRLGPYALAPLSVLAVFLLLSEHALALQMLRWELGWSRPALFVMLFGLLLASLQFARTRVEKDRLYAHLASYLPVPVAQALLGQDVGATVVAERREVTVMFADIRNFSRFCETQPPEVAARLLHEFIDIATQVIEERGGLVEAVQGDAVMAIWNGSLPCPDHARQAVAAAKVLLPAVEAVFPVPDEADWSPLALGIGVETGLALIGSFGPARRRLHTALGESVSVANAVQKMTAELASPILCGPGTAACLEKGETRSQGAFLLEGLARTHTLYAIPTTSSSRDS